MLNNYIMRNFIFLTFSFLIFKVSAQEIWTARSGNTYELNREALTDRLELLITKNSKEILIPFPSSTGIKEYNLVLHEVFSPALQAKFPFIHSFKGTDINGKTTISVTCNKDLFTLNFIENGSAWKLKHQRKNYYSLEKDTSKVTKDFSCNTPISLNTIPQKKNISTQARYFNSFTPDKQRRIIRFAVAVAGETSDYFINKANAQSASETEKKGIILQKIEASLNQINIAFERDLGVTLQLVADNDKIIYLDKNSDPFSDINTVSLLSTITAEAQSIISNIIGDSNYDIGHIITSPNNGGTGEALIASLCDNSRKATAISASSEPEGFAFDFTLFAHEIGHQLGGNHTFNAFCGPGTRNSFTSIEVSSGTTIMGYSGACGDLDIQPTSDPYFHTVSIDEILNTFQDKEFSCSVEKQPILNNLPIITELPSQHYIPIGTPFFLDATATDSDGDNLTYSWEQLDTDIGSSPPESTDPAGPLFRVYNPIENSRRYFPTNSSTGQQTNSSFEILPSTERLMTFNVLVRDGKPQGISYSNATTINTVGNTPFTVGLPKNTNGNTIESFLPMDTVNLTWTKGISDEVLINTQNVSIDLINNETGVETNLIASTPNDGQEDIVIPLLTPKGNLYRFRVTALDNIFFNVSNTFKVDFPTNTDFLVTNSQEKTSNYLIFNIKKVNNINKDREIILTFKNGISGEVLNLTTNNIEISFDGINYSSIINNVINENSFNDSVFLRIPLNFTIENEVIEKVTLEATVLDNDNVSKSFPSTGNLIPLELTFRDTIKIFPIPAINEIVTITSAFTLINGDFIEVTFFDLNGQIVQKNSISETVEQISVSGLASGIYILQIEKNGKETANYKILVQ